MPNNDYRKLVMDLLRHEVAVEAVGGATLRARPLKSARDGAVKYVKRGFL